MNRYLRVANRLVARLSRRGIDSFVELGLSGVEGRILNLGCGRRNAARGDRVREIGVDIRPHPAAHARGDAHRLPFADDSFDAVVSMEVLEHLHSPERVVDEVQRVLKPGGRLVLTTRFIFHIHGAPIDYYRYTRYGLEYLFRDFADLRVQSQHSGYMSFLVTAGRLIAEEAAIFRILALPLGVLVNLLALLDPLMRRVLPIEGLTTGYFVSCRK